ncbi:MAG: RNA 2',3'-cyclic phosphodiesterase [Candidatus Aenigmarchaeota archaeon]|nr:RNA 2',3'-cyclic phosphodiesterase [Candidatus Aenigmarchaeota archaeon]
MVRCFIGLDPPKSIKTNVISYQSKLRELPIMCKMVEPENLHISLSFLGDVHDEDIEVMSGKMDEIVEGYSRFTANMSVIELIPNKDFIRVISLGVESSELEKLRQDIVKMIGGESHPAHLTLCRVKEIDNKNETIQKILDLKTKNEEFEVESIVLFKSVLQKGGPVYTKLHESFLAASDS